MVNDSNILKEFGDRVRLFREKKGWTLEDLAVESGLHPSSISQVERGERNLTLKNLSRLADGLDVDPYQLLLYNTEEIMNQEEASRFKVREMLETAPGSKKELMFNLSRILMEWDPAQDNQKNENNHNHQNGQNSHE